MRSSRFQTTFDERIIAKPFKHFKMGNRMFPFIYNGHALTFFLVPSDWCVDRSIDRGGYVREPVPCKYVSRISPRVDQLMTHGPDHFSQPSTIQ